MTGRPSRRSSSPWRCSSSMMRAAQRCASGQGRHGFEISAGDNNNINDNINNNNNNKNKNKNNKNKNKNSNNNNRFYRCLCAKIVNYITERKVREKEGGSEREVGRGREGYREGGREGEREGGTEGGRGEGGYIIKEREKWKISSYLLKQQQ